MSKMRTWLRPNFALAIAGTLVLTACGDGGSSPGPGGGDGGTAGSIFVSGSSTVEPITTRVAEKFREQNPGFDFTVEGPGTGDGFALFCNGETDISDASRAIRDSEAAACADNDIEFVEIFVAYDGLAVLTSVDNTDTDCLSFLDLYALLGPESTGFNRWAAADGLAAELEADLGTAFGTSHAPYPDADLVVTAPGEESGTYDTFVEIAIGGIAGEREQEDESRPDYVASANDNVIIEGISGSRTSLGWVGLAFARENEGVVKALEIDRGDGCVAPSDETVIDGSYPIARPLYIYVNTARAAENESLAAFVDFYLTDEGIASVGEVGYVDAAPDEIDASRSAWEGR